MGSLCTIFLGLALTYILFDKVTHYLEADPNTFTVTQGLEYGYFPEETKFDKHLFAVGLSYRAEYQDGIRELFTEVSDQVADIEFFMRTKVAGGITVSDPLVLDPCSTLDLNNFYDPRKSSASSMDYLQKYKPMQCLDESANIELTPTRQQSN